jgi:uncharacterized protein (DUF885 family)
MTPMFRFCDDFVTRWAALDPVGIGGYLAEPFGAATDYSPSGQEAWADLMSATLSALDGVPVTSEQDRLAAAHLRERLAAELAMHRAGESLRNLRTPFGLVNDVRDSVDLLPHDGDEDWRNVAARLRAIPEMFAGWRKSLDEGLARGLPAARRQAVEGAIQADRYAAGTHDALVASYGDGPLAAELAAAASAAHAGYAEIATYLRSYAPRAAEADAVGIERYVLAARLSLGADLDPGEAYEWGWAELARIESELAAEAHRVRPGASVDEAIAILNETAYVDGADAYLDWLRERHARAVAELDGVHFDIAPPLRAIDVVLAHGSTSGAAYYTPPSEDLSRPGRTWWPLSGRQRFHTWNELSTVFHEGVPGHHLQDGAAVVASESLSRYSKCTFVSGHGEGWALYAERLADELGWFDADPGTRLGMLAAQAMRAARVVIDIGVHLDLPLPDGSRWTFEKACEVLRDRGRTEPTQVHAEVVRYFGWPAQAISYKLGERAWLEARAEAARQPGFDLKRWHTAALDLGPIALDRLAAELRAI